ncbi:MAG: hypothetical protein K0Q89_51 [Thermomicrobiales bacterium]|jgi:hypothetical protein|nr:hypothetical protein [Thermomicrobiales bacterium]
MSNLNIPGATWLQEQFEHEYCAECHGDAPHHVAIPFMGNWFARCRQPIAADILVRSQGESPQHGYVLDEPHPLDGWVWVQWNVTGRWDEAVDDLTIVELNDGSIARGEPQ